MMDKDWQQFWKAMDDFAAASVALEDNRRQLETSENYNESLFMQGGRLMTEWTTRRWKVVEILNKSNAEIERLNRLLDRYRPIYATKRKTGAAPWNLVVME